MKEKKKLKKLSLKKETIVNLNDHEMVTLKGGSTIPCLGSVTVATAISIYQETKSAWWTCPPIHQPSDRWMWVGEERLCIASEIDVYGVNTSIP